MQRIKMARGIGNPQKTVFISFSGPIGVGKPKCAKRQTLGHSLAPLDMYEYMERSAVSRLIAPTGYGGFDKGGLRTGQHQADIFRTAMEN